jgi:hypothetical protein
MEGRPVKQIENLLMCMALQMDRMRYEDLLQYSGWFSLDIV